ncbi:MAG: ABC transporter ATP-binding protein [Pirellulales bacterium]
MVLTSLRCWYTQGMMADLDVSNVSKNFPTRGEPLCVLRDVSLNLSAGQSLAIVGPSGSGKSTLLHILGTLDRPTEGNVQLDGKDPFQFDERQLADFRNHKIVFVFQDHHLLGQCNALENVLLPTIANGTPAASTVERARDLLAQVGLSERLDHRPAELSGGERQRVAIARALIQSPVLLLADEPTGNLDHTTAVGVAEMLLELQQCEKSMLIAVTHSDELAGRMERRFELDEGRLREANIKS